MVFALLIASIFGHIRYIKWNITRQVRPMQSDLSEGSDRAGRSRPLPVVNARMFFSHAADFARDLTA
jgi:hypothetical protein